MPCPCEYTVKKGETWGKIARAFQVPASRLRFINPDAAGKKVKRGQVSRWRRACGVRGERRPLAVSWGAAGWRVAGFGCAPGRYFYACTGWHGWLGDARACQGLSRPTYDFAQQCRAPLLQVLNVPC